MFFTIVVLQAHFPDCPQINIGVIVVDETANRFDIRCRTDFDSITDSENAEVLSGMEALLESMALEHGATYVLGFLEDSASNVVRVSDRIQIEAAHITKATAGAFQEYVLQQHAV